MNEMNQFNKVKSGIFERIYEWNQQLIDTADRKVAALLLINAVIISFSVTWNVRECYFPVKIVMIIAIVLSAFSSIMFLLTIFPRVSKHAGGSLLYYKGILKFTRDQYVSKMKEITDQHLSEDYLNTIYSLSLIQLKKNRYLRLGSQALIISISLLGLSFILNNIW